MSGVFADMYKHEIVLAYTMEDVTAPGTRGMMDVIKEFALLKVQSIGLLSCANVYNMITKPIMIGFG